MAESGGSNLKNIQLSQQTKELAKILQRRHDDYKALSSNWTMYQAAYTGGDDVLPYLYQHSREADDSFTSRKKRAFYFNYVKQILNLFVSYSYRKPIVRKTDQEQITKFWDNADGSSEGIEHPLENFLKEVELLYLLFGKAAIVVDMPSPQLDESGEEKEVESEADREEQNLNPYVYFIKPQNITDWQYDENGQLDWIRIEEQQPTPTDALGARSSDQIWKYTTWTKQEFIVHILTKFKDGSVAAEEKKRRSHGLEKVPVIMVMRKDNLKFGTSSGESLVKDIAVSNMALYNLTTLVGEEFYNHAMNILVMPARVGDKGDVVIGSNNVLEYAASGAPPHFLSPSSVPVESLQGFLDKIIKEMQRMSRLSSTDSAFGDGQGQSGVAQAFSFSDSNQALSDVANLFEEIESRVLSLVSLWLGKDPKEFLADTSIVYPTDFGIDLFDDELETMNLAVQNIVSETFATVLKKRTAKKFLAKETDEIVKQVETEIEASEKQNTKRRVQEAQQLNKEGQDEAASTQTGQTQDTAPQGKV